MKNIIIIFLIFSLFSCNKNKQQVEKFQKFIDIDINADYKNYFDKLSSNYINVLKIKYKTQDSNKIYDILVSEHKGIHDSIKLGVYRVKNTMIDSVISKEKNIRILKYRLSLFDTKHQSEMYQEKVVIEITKNKVIKYIPYNPGSVPQTDSLIVSSYSQKLLDEISSTLKFKEYDENSKVFKKTKNRFVEYHSLFKTDNLSLLNFVYPPIFQALLKENNQVEFTLEQKKQFLDYIKKGKDSQKLNFKKFLIDKFKKTDCNEKDAYLLDYAIYVGNNLYIPAKLIVIQENEEIYFIEADFSELKTNYLNVFSEDFINCLEHNSEK
ncbi:hypothetical protein [Flavobacterium salmonis]|uniref:Uncharacterized protein n=1 Tax=Flavobacterium salmonis TaxID=2654844 RepID=A0A6V6ZD86_9FLAO|nr:hypothetical protein [Flavobacterium salmonis]CAD0009771.1 hypothetical protein FLAT13_05087 [Flavobacterium salmonis]